MKHNFLGFYNTSPSEKQNIINSAIITIDSSLLLDVIRIQHGELFLKILNTNQFVDRLWLPYDAAWMYHNLMHDVIKRQIDKVKSSLSYLQRFNQYVENPSSHPYIDEQTMIKLNMLTGELRQQLQKEIKELSLTMRRNNVKDSIATLFDEKLGTSYDESEMIQLIQEAKKLYSSETPPCVNLYRSNIERVRFHNYIAFMQMIKKSKECNKPICFITNRITPDWFYTNQDSIISTRHELINSFYNQTENKFLCISAYWFVSKYGSYALQPHQKESLLKQLHKTPKPITDNTIDNNELTSL